MPEYTIVLDYLTVKTEHKEASTESAGSITFAKYCSLHKVWALTKDHDDIAKGNKMADDAAKKQVSKIENTVVMI